MTSARARTKDSPGRNILPWSVFLVALATCAWLAISFATRAGDHSIRPPGDRDAQASNAPPTWVDAPAGAISEPVPTGERDAAGESPVTVPRTILLRDADGGDVLRNITAVCTPDGNVMLPPATKPRALTTDGSGAIALPEATWSIDATASGWGPATRVDVRDAPTTVWLWPIDDVQVHVRDHDGKPLPGALVALCRDGETTRATQRTDGAGRATFAHVQHVPNQQLLVTHRDFLPSSLFLMPHGRRGEHGERIVDVELSNAHERALVTVLDDEGVPFAGAVVSAPSALAPLPSIELGISDEHGQLTIAGKWPFEAAHWEVAGAAYDVRCAIPSRVAASAELRLVVPRRCAATFAVAPSPTAIDWRLSAPDLAPQGLGLLYRTVTSPAHATAVPVDLPLRRAIAIEAVSSNKVVARTTVTATVPGEVIPIHLAPPPADAVRRVTLRSEGSALVLVRCNGLDLLTATAPPAQVITCDVPLDAVSIVARTQRGNEHLLTGASVAGDVADPNNQRDVVITIPDPPRIATDVVVRDREGRAIGDAIVRLARQDNRVVPTDAPGWRRMLSGNVVRAVLDATGTARAALPPGRYEAALEHLPARDFFGVPLLVHEGQEFEVHGPGPLVVTIAAARPRRVHVVLDTGDERLPQSWQLRTRHGVIASGGRAVTFWTTDEAAELSILDQSGVQLGSAQLPAGATNATCTIPIRAPR
jgi:hypothetical protein